MGRFIYNLLLPVYLLVALPGWWIKMRRRGGYGAHFGERFGFYARAKRTHPKAERPPWWIHAVSVGEVLVAVKLLQRVRARFPEQSLMLSTTSSTGYATACERVPEGIPVIYHPLDLPGIVGRVLARWRPGCLVLMESELWPNLLAAANRRGCPVVIANARLSPRSARRYARFRRQAAPTLDRLTAVLTQEEGDAQAWQAAGLRTEKIHCVGSIKVDPAADRPPSPEQVRALGEALASVWGEDEKRDSREAFRRHVLLLGSSHAGEEKAVSEVYARLRHAFPGLRLILVPRHAERAEEIGEEIEGLGLPVVRRTRLSEFAGHDRREVMGEDPPVILVDTTGELRGWYALADTVIMGKSFLGRGGQNPVEPIMAGRPVVVGPHMENFAALTELLRRERGICQVSDLRELEAALREWLEDEGTAARLATAGRKALESHAGATDRTVDKLLEISGKTA